MIFSCKEVGRYVVAGAGVGAGAGEKKIPRAGQKRTGSATLVEQCFFFNYRYEIGNFS